MINKALFYATKWHRGQTRKYTKEPYINHPYRVMSILISAAYITDPVVLSAAVLHDTVEDCNIKPFTITNLFGEEISKVVIELTNVYTAENYPNLNRCDRKRQEFTRIANCSLAARTIKCADKIDNSRDRCPIFQKWENKLFLELVNDIPAQLIFRLERFT